MQYYSTNRQSGLVSFREATIMGQAPDRGLFFPRQIPKVDKSLIENIENISDEEIAFQVIYPYTGSDIAKDKLYEIIRETLSFPIPLVPLDDRIFSLELFHGPTMAFKDVGARFMSRCLGHFATTSQTRLSKQTITVLVATSGDTGGAVADGFYGVEGVEVVILYPSGKVSLVQEKQLTTYGDNIHTLEVAGTFDDCQKMVKQAFADEDLKRKLFLTSANSINVARWLPQQFYYFLAYKQWKDKANPPVISVPSGNFGNICAGILATRSGLPVKHFIAACNANDVVSEYLQTQSLKPKQAVPTLSNAMDVGDPSNFIRIIEIFQHRFPDLKECLSSYSITDKETMSCIKRIFRQYGYCADPHGAVGYCALERYLEERKDDKGIFLETAHPVKFPTAVEKATGRAIELPPHIAALLTKEKQSTRIKPDFNLLKSYLFEGIKTR